MTKSKGIKAADDLMRKLIQVPKSELPAPKQPAKKRKAAKRKKDHPKRG